MAEAEPDPFGRDAIVARVKRTIVAKLDVPGLAQQLATDLLVSVPAVAEIERQWAKLRRAEEEARRERQAWEQQLAEREDALAYLGQLARDVHDRHHPGGFAVCDDPICRGVVDHYERTAP